MKKLLVSLFLLTYIILFPDQLSAQSSNQNIHYYEGVIREIQNESSSQHITIQATSGDANGKRFATQLFETGDKGIRYKKGQKVIFTYNPEATTNKVLIVDVVRQTPLYILFFIFLSVVFIVGKKQGISSLIGMLFSFLIIMKFVVPGIVSGNDPTLISLFAAILIIPFTFILAHGFGRKTIISAAGTLFSLTLTGILSYTFIIASHITGFALEDAVFVQSLVNQSIDIRNLLLAGIIIGAMGILDDITISQSSLVEKLFEANPKLTKRELYGKAMSVGKDHIASLVNTLILVYAGASLPLFILFTNSGLPISLIINNEIVATEIIRTLVSSIGIVLAVPITTFLACHFVKKK